MREERGNKARSAAATKGAAKSTVWIVVTALCFDSILPAVLHFSPAGIAVGISHRDCRVFKFIYFLSFDIFYSLRLPWSHRSELQHPRIPEIDCTTKIFETISTTFIAVSLFLNKRKIIITLEDLN